MAPWKDRIDRGLRLGQAHKGELLLFETQEREAMLRLQRDHGTHVAVGSKLLSQKEIRALLTWLKQYFPEANDGG